MNNNNNNNKPTMNLTCPICSEKMNEDFFAYDHNVNGKVYFKCPCCGHKYAKIN